MIRYFLFVRAKRQFCYLNKFIKSLITYIISTFNISLLLKRTQYEC